jgi:hypothetical protein
MSEILNSTVYETSDIVNIVAAVYDLLKKKGRAYASPPTVKKIRYLNAKKRSYNWRNRGTDDSFANVMGGGYYHRSMEICILRPSKVELNALIALAEAATGDDKNYSAPQKVTRDVITSIYNRLIKPTYGPGETRSSARDAAINLISDSHSICINPTAKGRKAYTLANLKKRVVSKQNGIENIEYKIIRAKASLKYYEDKLPVAKAALKKLETNLAAKEAAAKEKEPAEADS